MIGITEIEEQAAHLDLHTSNVQRDYVFGWLISGIYRASKLGEILILKGGNALRKGYIPETRFSDDLDFTTEQGLDGDFLIRELNDVCSFVQEQSGVVFDIGRNRIIDEQRIDGARNVFKIKLYFKDFAGGSDHITLSVRVDITEFDRLYLPIQSRQLIHPYSDLSICGTDIRCVKLEEVFADKLKCLLQRRSSYDLFDLAYGLFIRNDLAIDRSEVMSVFFRKTIFGPSPLAAKQLLIALPLELFKGFWNKVTCPAPSRIPFDRAVDVFMTGLELLFKPFDYGARAAVAFFPAAFRNPIMEAASTTTTLLLTYQGITREVEPYSLAFKRRKDGVAREYFYAFDLTGGHTRGPSIKAFVPDGIEDIRITGNTFTPRFPIELSKAGDSSMTGYFGGRSFTRAAGTRRGVRTGSSTTHRYIIQCSSCGKRFRRSKPGTRLNAHKDNYGNRCYGRSGFRVY